MPVIDIHHVALNSADIEATAAFYNDVLGTRTVDRPDFDFPGLWLQAGQTMIHIIGGYLAENADGVIEKGGAAVNHVAFRATGFDDIRARLKARGLAWKENLIPEIGMWQIFVSDPNGVMVELNFMAADEPEGTAGPAQTIF